MLSKEQTALLRKIKHSKCFNMTLLPEIVQEDVWFLISQKYVEYQEVHIPDENYNYQLVCNITPLGKAALYERHRENRHWFIPVVISSIALFKSFLPEIIVAVELLLKLLMQ